MGTRLYTVQNPIGIPFTQFTEGVNHACFLLQQYLHEGASASKKIGSHHIKQEPLKASYNHSIVLIQLQK